MDNNMDNNSDNDHNINKFNSNCTVNMNCFFMENKGILLDISKY